MPVQSCQENNKPGWRWGTTGKCYTYKKGDEKSSARAKEKAKKQGRATHVKKSAEGDTRVHPLWGLQVFVKGLWR